jgi:type III restriction enzyme
MSGQSTLNGKPRHRIELDDKIKKAVVNWRARGFEGASDVTKRLLTYWFLEDHYDSEGRPFSFWQAQREAIEALIYVYEVAKYDSLAKLVRGFNVTQVQPTSHDPWPKYAFKMATGSGKTFVMELAIVWQYFNKIYGTDNGVRYSSHFLVLAPNIIVFDRLRESFQDVREIRRLPFIPPEWTADFDVQVVLQSERTIKHGKGVIFLTNIQQLYEREEEPINPIDEYLGPKPRNESDPIANWEYLYTSLTKYDDLIIINDEAHHVHSPELEWNKTINRLNEGLTKNFGKGLVMQLDFSATPKDLKGKLFPHIIYDYPLRDAIRDKKVKRPRIGLLENVPPPPKKPDFVLQNKAQIDIGIQNLLEFKKELQPSGKKPVLFIMTDSTKHADQVGKYLEQERGFKDRVLVIHTDNEGNITKADLPRLREAARNIDTNQYEIIVSVMMLKEGWDVRNVVVIVPLRAFTSELLPEQTLGRGLRRMFPHSELIDEPLIVIDHPRFRQLWEAEIKTGDLEADILPSEKVKPVINTIMVDPSKSQFDFDIPVIEGGTVRCVPKLDELNLSALPAKIFKLDDIRTPTVMYREKDLLTNEIVREKELAFDYTDDFNLYLSYITSAIVKKAKTPTLFPELVPKVEDYITNYLFESTIDTSSPDVVRKLNDPKVREKIVEVFVSELIKLSTVEEPATLTRYFKLSSTQVLHTTKSPEMLHKPLKSVFNLLPADSQYEIDFMRYLDNKFDVLAYTRIFRESMPMRILYHDDKGYIHYYIPDFIVKTVDCYYLVETKGEKYDTYIVKYKDKAAENWCKTASKITNSCWNFVKIMYKDFQKYSGLRFNDLVTAVKYVQPRLNDNAAL